MLTAALMLALQAATPAPAAAAPAASPAPAPDYTKADAWLCRPDIAGGACAQPLDTTVIAADGKRTAKPFSKAANPAFDCFYVYPTVSTDPTPNSDMTPDPAEMRVIQAQAARFGEVCRVFAPMYRQVTLTALRSVMAGQPMAADRAMGLSDVRAAWNDYLARDNKGRGVVLIGHSQGSGVLKELIKSDIDGKPAQDRIISAMLLGNNIAVPDGKDVGGDFQSMPLCRASNQSGCIVTYVSFRADSPPPANSRFGKVEGAGMVAGCTNPAALAGGKGTPRNYLSAGGAGGSGAEMGPWTKDGAPVSTPFVQAPGLLTTECVKTPQFSYLAVTVNGDPADPRTDTIVGDVVANGTILKDWGLHLIDVNIDQGDLIALADSQAKAWMAKHRK